MTIKKFTVLIIIALFVLILSAILPIFNVSINGDVQMAEALVCDDASGNGFNGTVVGSVCAGPGVNFRQGIDDEPGPMPISSKTAQAHISETQISVHFTRDRIKVARHPFLPVEPPFPGKDCSITSVGLTPLNDMSASDDYFGENGGLYGNGMNSLPITDPHWQEAYQATLLVRPRNASGQIDDLNGMIGLISIGMSNTRYEFNTFMNIAERNQMLSFS